jgi:MFS family permease
VSKALHSASAALIGAFLCILLNPAIVGFYSFTIFFTSLSKELGWGRGVLGLSITIGTLAVAVVAPIAGRFADRGHARQLVVWSALLFAGLLALMPILAKSLIGLYVAFGLIGVLTACYYVSLPRIISSWFDARRGLALGFVMSAAGLGSALLAPILAAVIAKHGWPTAYLVLAGAVLVIAFPSALLLLHERPTASTAHAAGAAQAAQPSEKPKITGELVLFAASFLLMGLGLHGVLINFSPILTDRGITPGEAAGMFAIAGAAMFLARLGCGFIIDLLPANRVGAVVMIGAAVGVALLYYGDGRTALIVAACLFGIGIGAELDLLSYIISRRFPMAHFSRQFSFVYSTFMIGTAFGPPLLGGLFDKFGDYKVGVMVSVVMVLLAALALALMPRTPTRTSKVEQEPALAPASSQ